MLVGGDCKDWRVEIQVQDLCWLMEIARTGGLVEIQVQDLCWLVGIVRTGS